MVDITLPPDTRPGVSNGRFLAYLSMGESREELLARYKRGELPGLNVEYAKGWLEGK